MLSPIAAIDSWVWDEFSTLDLGDSRLDDRFRVILTDMLERPSASLPVSSGNWGSTKASYRFLHNSGVELTNVPECHIEQTLRRASSTEVLLAIQDSTQLDYSSHLKTEGLGVLQTQELHGLMLHTTLAVTEDGEALGILDLQQWVRPEGEFGKSHCLKERSGEEKESNKWLVGVRATKAFNEILPQTLIVHVADREADIYRLLAMPRPEQQHLLVRAHHNRALSSQELRLWPFMKEQAPQGKLVVEVPGGHGKKARKAELAVRYSQVELQAPRIRQDSDAKPLPPVTIWVVLAQEEGAAGKGSLISWMLLSTLPVNTLEDAAQRIRWYTRRWRIEMFHRILKSGCDVESCRLADAESLMRYITLKSMVAWRVLYCTTTGREHPDWPSSVLLDEDEWKVLYCLKHKTKQAPSQPPPLGEAIRWIAQLGGFLARKGDGHPGAQTIQAGFERLADFVTSYTIFKT